MNTIIISGNLTRDCEVKYTNSGNTLIKFAVAVNDEFKRDTVYFMECVKFAKENSKIQNYLNKGQKVIVKGQMTYSDYDNKKYWSITCSNIELIGINKSNDDSLPWN